MDELKEVYINSLDELKQWNNYPCTILKPFVWDWFQDYLFEVVLEKVNYELFLEYFDEMIKFTVICENLSEHNAIERTVRNLEYVNDRNSYNSTTLKLFLEDIKNKNNIIDHAVKR